MATTDDGHRMAPRKLFCRARTMAGISRTTSANLVEGSLKWRQGTNNRLGRPRKHTDKEFVETLSDHLIPCSRWAWKADQAKQTLVGNKRTCLLYTSDAADDM
eukprot:940503-Prorocentrum_lima.AAC.1